ncbi:MAG: lysophospholipid acyltransferase family protein [Planctomycetota bacterium]|jgi:KDO2-lipid IV(A) lauroyltransferase
MASDRHMMKQFAEYVAARALFGFMNMFDVDQNLATAGLVGSSYFKIVQRHRERTSHNIARSFPDWSAEQVAWYAEESLRYMFRLFMVDAMVMTRKVTQHSLGDHVRFGKIDPLPQHLASGEPLLMVTAHCGNWEMLGHALTILGYPMTALARPLDNRFLNDWFLGIRQASGMRILTKWGAANAIPDLIKARGHIGFVADQNAGDTGLFVPFFGRMASSYKSIGIMAMQFEVPIAVGVAHRIGPNLLYQLSCEDFITPDDWADQPDPLFYITARWNRRLEEMIRVHPEQYLWIHRRWKSRPRHERRGKPIPPRTVDKLRALPWMTDDELAWIQDESARDAAAYR